MNIRNYRNEDKEALVALWKTVFPNDPPHNAPSKVIEQKLAVEDRMSMGCHSCPACHPRRFQGAEKFV